MKSKDNELVSRAPRSRIYDTNKATIPVYVGYNTPAPGNSGARATQPDRVKCPSCGTFWVFVPSNRPINITCHGTPVTPCSRTFNVAQALAAQTATSSPTYAASQLTSYPSRSSYTTGWMSCPHCSSTLTGPFKNLAARVDEWRCTGVLNRGTPHTVVVCDDLTP